MKEKLLTWFWAWRLRRVKRRTGILACHEYPPDTVTGWRKDKLDYRRIKASARMMLMQDIKKLNKTKQFLVWLCGLSRYEATVLSLVVIALGCYVYVAFYTPWLWAILPVLVLWEWFFDGFKRRK